MIKPILAINNLSFQYDKRSNHKNIDNISLAVAEGQWIAVIGQNGSGKSTLARIIVGLLEPQTGQIFVEGIEINEATKWKLRQKIGIVFQNPDNQFIGTTVQDDIAFGLENINMPYKEMVKRVDWALELTGMGPFRHHDPSRLSGGQKQRVAIASILALKPSIIVLDEAFVMLDPKSRESLISTLLSLRKTENISIISITHDMNEAAAADHILRMKNGRIIKSGTPKEILQEDDELAAPIGEQLRRTLKKRGYQVPDSYMTEDGMVKWLWK